MLDILADFFSLALASNFSFFFIILCISSKQARCKIDHPYAYQAWDFRCYVPSICARSSSHLFFVLLKSKILSSFEWQLFIFWIVFFFGFSLFCSFAIVGLPFFLFFLFFIIILRAFHCRRRSDGTPKCPVLDAHIMAIMCGKYMGSWSWRSKPNDEVRERALFRWWWW